MDDPEVGRCARCARPLSLSEVGGYENGKRWCYDCAEHLSSPAQDHWAIGARDDDYESGLTIIALGALASGMEGRMRNVLVEGGFVFVILAPPFWNPQRVNVLLATALPNQPLPKIRKRGEVFLSAPGTADRVPADNERFRDLILEPGHGPAVRTLVVDPQAGSSA